MTNLFDLTAAETTHLQTILDGYDAGATNPDTW